MANFIQPEQLSGVQGTIGNQQVVNVPQPTAADLAAPVLKQADAAADMYVESKAKSLVKEEIENVDAAIAHAEGSRFTAGDPVPESLKVDQREWDMLAAGIHSGQLSRENARLIASSRLRSRIAEEPFFANRMRKAASGVLGFNIESEAAQQYFNSFSTNASIAQQQNASKDKKREDMMNTARRFKEVGVFDSIDEGYSMLVKAEASDMRVKMAEDELALNGITSQKFGSEFLKEERVKGWGTLLTEIKVFEEDAGKPIDGVAFSKILDKRKQDAINRFNQSWVNGEAPLNTPEYDRALSNVVGFYEEMKDYAESYGIDNLTDIEIARNVQARELFGDKYFSTMKAVIQIHGQQIASDIVKMAGLSPSQRERMFQNNPQLRTAYGLASSDPEEFNSVLSGAAISLLNGEDIKEQDGDVVDAAAKFLYDSGNEASQNAVVKAMFEGGLQHKGTSLLVTKSPARTSDENKATLVRQYKEGIDPLMNQLAVQVADDPSISFEVGADGRVTVSQDSAQGAMPGVDPASGLVINPRETQARLMNFRKAKQTADKINLYQDAHGTGWSREFGETVDEYALRLEKLGKSSTTDAGKAAFNRTLEDMSRVADLISVGNIELARETYNDLRIERPMVYRMSFEEALEEAGAWEE